MLRAEKSASFDDFIEMVSKLVCLTMEDQNVEFLPDENKHVIIAPDMKTDKTYITYRLISRIPEREIKPMAREEIIEPGINKDDERYGLIYGQRFDCIVQFNIFASEYIIANKVMRNFEEMIFSFTGYMKSKGVQSILFKGQSTDSDFDIYRKTMSVRCASAEDKITNRLPKKDTFKISNPSQIKIQDKTRNGNKEVIIATSKLEQKDFSASKKYNITIENVEDFDKTEVIANLDTTSKYKRIPTIDKVNGNFNFEDGQIVFLATTSSTGVGGIGGVGASLESIEEGEVQNKKGKTKVVSSAAVSTTGQLYMYNKSAKKMEIIKKEYFTESKSNI